MDCGVTGFSGSVVRYMSTHAKGYRLELLDSLSLTNSVNERRIQIIGELSINSSVQFIVLTEISGSRLPVIPHPRSPEISRFFSITGSANYNDNPGSAIVAGI